LKKVTIAIITALGSIALVLLAFAIAFGIDRDNAREVLLEEKNRSYSLEKQVEQLQTELEDKEDYNQELQRALAETEEDLMAANAGLAQSIIVGRVYADANDNGNLDWEDRIVSSDLDGFKVVLYESKENGTAVEVASTDVENGQYKFLVPAGEYFVGIRYGDTTLYSRRYNLIKYIGGGNLIVKEGEIILASTIFLTNP